MTHWTREEIVKRFREAGDTVRRLPRAKGPDGYGSGWPPYVRDARDAYGYHAARLRLPAPTPGAIDRMHEVFGWFVHFDGREQEMRAVWACVGLGYSFSQAARVLGISRPTIRGRCWAGVERLVAALNR